MAKIYPITISSYALYTLILSINYKNCNIVLIIFIQLNFIKKIFTYLLLFFAFTFLKAQELPPINNYDSKAYGAGNQNWAISQSSNKYIYVANNDGLLEFNGSKWQLYPSPNNTVIRYVNVINNRIYTGCYMEFGYWDRNEFGSLKYTSLSDKVQEPLVEEEFWNIIEFDNWILFQSLHRIYIYNTENKSFKIINSKTQLPKVYKVDGSIYFQKMGEGIYKIENGNPVLISNHPVVKKNILVNIFSINKKILFQTQDQGFYFLSREALTKWNISANSLISSISVYSSVKLNDGRFILGTISNGIYILDKEGNILNNINQEKGLNNNTVLSMFEDEEHNLWLGLDNGISIVNLNSPYKVFNDINGKLGTVYTSAIFNNNLFLGTNQGLFYKKLKSNTDFHFMKGTNGQVWSLKVYDNTLFCGHNYGTFIVNVDSVDLIAEEMGTWDIKPIKNNENLLIQGNYDGLNVLEKINKKWQFRNKIEGFNLSSRFFDFSANNRLIVNHEYKGVFKINLDNAYKKVLDFKVDDSAPKGLKSSLVNYNNDLFYTSNKGVFKYNNSLQKFEIDSILTNNLFDNENYISGKLIAENITNTLWGFTEKHIVYFSPGKLNKVPKVTKIWLPVSLRRDIAGYESITHIDNQKYLFGTSSGYIILDLDKLKERDFNITINSIKKSILNDETTFVKIEGKGNNEYKYRENNLFFTYSVPEFDTYTEVNYQYQLEGMYNDWSSWSTKSEVSFKNLPFGKYTFKVNAQIGNKLSNNVATYSFTINRPWVISNQMIFVYFILLILLLLLIHIFYNRYYTKQKIVIIEKKQREFALTQLESDQKLMQIKNEQLNHEIESKNRELTISTMSIIKKNEILNRIKKELMVSKGAELNKQAIKTIDKNINNKKDWEFLEEAFNNADKDFLKKVKTLHPDLTPNDLRFCAYLRLNLSSKEIAPLLNISVRSIEIKRYRLRKKMSLSHETSLVSYILAI